MKTEVDERRIERVQIQCERLMIVTLQECRGDHFCLRANS
jgi:hypothetical protein